MFSLVRWTARGSPRAAYPPRRLGAGACPVRSGRLRTGLDADELAQTITHYISLLLSTIPDDVLQNEIQAIPLPIGHSILYT